jgi:hypothetical protein
LGGSPLIFTLTFQAFYFAGKFSCIYHKNLATGQCDMQQAKAFVGRLNEKACHTIPTISFNNEMLLGNQLDGGACSAIAFRAAKETLCIMSRLQKSGLTPRSQEKSFAVQFTKMVSELEEIATSQTAPSKKIQEMIRSEQLALNTITVDRNVIKEGNAVKEKVSAMAPFYSMKVVHSTSELRVKANDKLEEELKTLIGELSEGVYFLRIIQENATANIDIRYPPAMEGKTLYADLVHLMQQDARIKMEITAEGLPHQVDVTQEYFKTFAEIAKKLYDIDITPTRSYGASDARFFGERHIPVVMISPQGGNIHSDGEWIDIKDLTRFYNVLKLWVLENQKEYNR